MPYPALVTCFSNRYIFSLLWVYLKLKMLHNFTFFVTSQKLLPYIYSWTMDGRGVMISFTIVNATRKLKHMQYAKKEDKNEYSSKVKSAWQRFHSLPMNIVKIIVQSIAYFFLLFVWHDNYLFTQGAYVYTFSTQRLAQCWCHK